MDLSMANFPTLLSMAEQVPAIVYPSSGLILCWNNSAEHLPLGYCRKWEAKATIQLQSVKRIKISGLLPASKGIIGDLKNQGLAGRRNNPEKKTLAALFPCVEGRALSLKAASLTEVCSLMCTTHCYHGSGMGSVNVQGRYFMCTLSLLHKSLLGHCKQRGRDGG